MSSSKRSDDPVILPFDSKDKRSRKRGEQDRQRFDGKAALITGASDRGIGGAIAERLAREGADVFLIGLEKPKRLISQLTRIGNEVHTRQCDVRSAVDIQTAIDECISKLARIDVVVNNAGIEHPAAFGDLDESDWSTMLEVNLHGAIRVAQTALPHLESTRGVIVNVSSALALAGCAGFSIYSASKAGLLGFTQSLAMELAPRGVRAVAVAPALVETPTILEQIKTLPDSSKQLFEAIQPLGIGNRHDVASAVAFLASQEARWITGVTLPLGWSQAYPLPTAELIGELAKSA
jgi:NAD(P)-dependent dehydrogenase (short-subunit alcohol dehydrogenase family)